MMILFWTEQENRSKHEKKHFEELVCRLNSCTFMCWFSMQLKLRGKFCYIIFHAIDNFIFFCIVWYVITTSSWMLTPNVEQYDFKYFFETPCGFKGYILPEVFYC